MPRIFVASSNRGKLKEFVQIAAAAGSDLAIESVPGMADIPEPDETGSTFEENARIKAIAYSKHIPGALVFADDSGLEVDALGGAPGIRSARFAARDENHKPPDRDNNWKLLQALSQHPTAERAARFVCVIALARDGEIIATFHGEASGEILQAEVGKHGFGYDPLFYISPANKTFAEMNAEEKATYSHRGAAFRKLLEYLRSS